MAGHLEIDKAPALVAIKVGFPSLNDVFECSQSYSPRKVAGSNTILQ